MYNKYLPDSTWCHKQSAQCHKFEEKNEDDQQIYASAVMVSDIWVGELYIIYFLQKRNEWLKGL